MNFLKIGFSLFVVLGLCVVSFLTGVMASDVIMAPSQQRLTDGQGQLCYTVGHAAAVYVQLVDKYGEMKLPVPVSLWDRVRHNDTLAADYHCLSDTDKITPTR